MISRWNGRVVMVATLLLIAAPMLAVAAETANVAGTWEVTWDAQEGPQTVTIAFIQDGEKLTGTYTDPGEHTSPVTGEVKGHAIEFAVDVESDEGVYTLTFHGTVQDDSMRGTMSPGGDQFFDWTGTKTG